MCFFKYTDLCKISKNVFDISFPQIRNGSIVSIKSFHTLNISINVLFGRVFNLNLTKNIFHFTIGNFLRNKKDIKSILFVDDTWCKHVDTCIVTQGFACRELYQAQLKLCLRFISLFDISVVKEKN